MISSKYSVSEVAKLFEVDRQTIKTWVFHFSDYLSNSANPEKGSPRKFLIEDIRVMAYISIYWEEEPDMESIKIGLNTRGHYESIDIENFINSITPVLREMPDNIDDTWRGVVFGGEYSLTDLFNTAESFKLAGDRLVEIAHVNYEDRELFQPAIYSYRHATELYIKAITDEEEFTHDLISLMNKLKEVLKEEHNALTTLWLENLVQAFHDSDPTGTAFRYGVTFPKEEIYIDMHHLKTLMDWLSQASKRIMIKQFEG